MSAGVAKQPFSKRIRSSIRNFKTRLRHLYWLQIVRRVNVKAYLRHLIDADQDFEDQTIRDDLACIETKEYMARARRVHMTLAEIPYPPGEETHWFDAYDGDRYLHYLTLTRVKKAVEDAEYERKKRRREGAELSIKWLTVIGAIIGAVAGVINLYITAHKK
jgi:hypothetical protein